MNARITFENVFGTERAVPFVTWFYDEPVHPGVSPSSRESSPSAPATATATDNKQSASESSQSGSHVKRHATSPAAGGGSDAGRGTTSDTTPEAIEAASDTSAGAGVPTAAAAGGNANGRKRVVCIVDEHAFQIPHDYRLVGMAPFKNKSHTKAPITKISKQTPLQNRQYCKIINENDQNHQ